MFSETNFADFCGQDEHGHGVRGRGDLRTAASLDNLHFVRHNHIMTRDYLLFTISGTAFGVLKSAIESAGPARRIHRLPLSPQVIAGVSEFGGSSAVIFDLAACLGMPPCASGDGETILLVNGGGQSAGFVVTSSVETASIDENSVGNLPSSICSVCTNRYFVRDGRIVPIIDILRLHGQLMSPAGIPPGDAGAAKAVPRPTEMSSIRFFTVGGSVFGMNGEGTSCVPEAARHITRLAYARPPLLGALLDGDEVIASADLARPLIAANSPEQGCFLIAPIGGSRFAFRVEADAGVMEQSEYRIQELPPVARTDQVPAAVLRDGAIVPIIDPARVLDPRQHWDRSGELPGQYHPASSFSSRFLKDDIGLVEFALPGLQIAVPKNEVKDLLPFLPYRPLPSLPEIVFGVAESGGMLLPVLDMAALFGGTSHPDREWRMLHVENGDFHALLIAQSASEERIVTLENQRRVPVSLPHELLYGCYLDGQAVRLILNVFSLTVHFEKTGVRELIAGLAPHAGHVKTEAPAPALSPAVESVPGRLAAESVQTAEMRVETSLQQTAEQAGEQEAAAATTELRIRTEPEGQRETAFNEATGEEQMQDEEEAAEKHGQQSAEANRGAFVQADAAAQEVKQANELPCTRLEYRETAQQETEQPMPREEAASSTAVVRKRKHHAAGFAIAAVLVFAIVVFAPKPAPLPEKHATPIVAPKPENDAAPGKKHESPLVLKIPLSMPKPVKNVYVVVKGDTLWVIARRFTGNPYNYPRLARDNSIATPDLIFPGQKIALIREE